ncbi:MAG: DNA polymerase [Candidatus Bathyarchaeota archaeon B63]|nr:MAG: DNA polymerase [Candidatus Bathyarchaeota archaeon B63]
MEQTTDLKRAISLIIEAGYQIDSDAFKALKEASKSVELEALVRGIIEEANGLPERPLFLERELIEKKAAELRKRLGEADTFKTGRGGYTPYAKEVSPEIEVLEDPTKTISTRGSLENYIEYFQDRFRRIRRILKKRIDSRDSGGIAQALGAPSNSRVKFICMLVEKRESSKGIFLHVEDMEDDVRVFVPSTNPDLYRKGQMLMLDQVICISAVKGGGDLLIAEDIIYPDLPMRKPRRADLPVYAALLSDMHVGSKMFMEGPFERFVEWLRGRVGNRRLREIASHVKYVIIAGDIVDGVGIYPKQIEELEIDDIYMQYEAAAKILEGLPEHIELILMPGNHDACRRALPQPAIPKDYAEPLYEAGGARLLGNPCMLSLHGVRVLVMHGRSLDDVISTVPGMSFERPDEAMRFLLQCRHLAPTYGSKTLIASEPMDHLVIENEPDIFHAGHVHRMSFSTYRGTTIVNSGAWQEQTEYQREMGHTPNPGIAPIIDLQSFKIFSLDFVSAVK